MDLNKIRKEAEVAPSEPSFAREVFLSWMRGETTAEERDRLVAGHTAHTIHDHKFFIAELQPRHIQYYVQSRITGRSERDASISRQTGEWIYKTMRIIDRNKHELDHVRWAYDICLKSKMEKEVLILRQFLDSSFASTNELFREYEDALKVQELDSLDKRWKQKNE